MNIEHELAQLQVELTALRDENTLLRQQLTRAQQQIETLEQRLAEVDQPPPKPPRWSKPATPTHPASPRAKRAPSQNRARRRDTVSRVVVQRVERCPMCGCRLQPSQTVRRRQVVDLPPPQPVEVVEYQRHSGWCAKCEQWHTPPAPVAGQTLGRGRFGVRLASLIATLRSSLRLTIRQIQQYLASLHGLTISVGAIVDVLQRVRQACVPLVEELTAQARASPVLQADETGWRENGQNGYVWCFSTPGTGPEAVRVYTYRQSRAGAVVESVLRHAFAGVLVSDFYGAYNVYAGAHQRCWVHLLRDLHTLKEAYPADVRVQRWCRYVRKYYAKAQGVLRTQPDLPQEARERLYVTLVERLRRLGLRYAQLSGHPCRALAKRLLRH